MLQTAENFTLLDFKLANLERFELSYAQLAFIVNFPPTQTKDPVKNIFLHLQHATGVHRK